MEIEAKFVIPNRDAMLRLQRVVRLGPFVPGDTAEHEIIDVYLDTKERALYQNGYACRMRQRAGGCRLTIKGLGGVEAAIHSRFESEQALPVEATADIETWPEGEGRALAQGLVGKEPLLELFVVEQERQVRPLRLEERLVAELSLDQVKIRAGGRARGYLCLEAELIGEGEIEDLRVLTEHLMGTWGLEPEPRSKFELGLSLLQEEPCTEVAVPEAPDLIQEDDLPSVPAGRQERGPSERLTGEERVQLERLVQEAPDERDRRYAALVLGWGERRSVRGLGEQIGFSQSWAYELVSRFQKERMAMFVAQREAEHEVQTAQESDLDVLSEAPVLPEGLDRASEPEVDVGVSDVEGMCARYQVDMAHARYVTEVALLLFDRTESIHHLDAERRRLLAVMATLHNVGLEVDPDRHHARGRDIVLENRLPELTEMEQRMLAAAVFLHRKRIRRRKLETGIVASLPLGLRHDALVLAALVRMADGLDYSQSQSTCVEKVQVRSAAVHVVATGPSAEIDVARAQAKADLWEVLYGDTPFFLVVRGQEQADVPLQAELGAAGALAVSGGIALSKSKTLKSPGILPEDPMSEAGRKVLAFHFARMLEHEPGTRAGTDIEELHDMRVATRRMRSAFRVFAPYYKTNTIRPYVVGLRRTARALGEVRDLDVLLYKARVYLEGLEPNQAGDLDLLLDGWLEQREQVRATMIHVLDSSKYHDFVDAFRLFLETYGAGARQSTRIPPRPRLVRHVAPLLIYGRWASVQAFGPLLEGAPISVLHALRIECKRLRYTLEFFREVLSPRAGEVIEAVVKLQDHLGDLNDADVANALLSDFLFASRPDGERERLIAPGVVAYLAVKQRELQTLVETFPQAWKTFNQADVRQALAGAVAVL